MVRGAVQQYARQWLVIRLCQLQPYRDLRDNRPRAPKIKGKVRCHIQQPLWGIPLSRKLEFCGVYWSKAQSH